MDMPDRIETEEQLETKLVENLGLLKKHNYNLKLYDHDGNSGRQHVCKYGGRIDLLCEDTENGNLVVIELKNVRATEKTFAQISTYMGYVQDEIAGKRAVKGIVIARKQNVNLMGRFIPEMCL